MSAQAQTCENSNLKAALAYAQRFGWAVLPLHNIINGRCTCSKSNCGNNAGKHGRTEHAVKDATVDPTTITAWWTRWPDANVGIATGAPSGIDVLDVDPRNGGDESLWELERKHGELPSTVMSLTGGCGSHVFFRHVAGLKNQSSKIAPGLDLKTTDGCIVAPPSMHLSGRPYRWEGASRPGEVPLPSFRSGCSKRRATPGQTGLLQSRSIPRSPTASETRRWPASAGPCGGAV